MLYLHACNISDYSARSATSESDSEGEVAGQYVDCRHLVKYLYLLKCGPHIPLKS